MDQNQKYGSESFVLITHYRYEWQYINSLTLIPSILDFIHTHIYIGQIVSNT